MTAVRLTTLVLGLVAAVAGAAPTSAAVRHPPAIDPVVRARTAGSPAIDPLHALDLAVTSSTSACATTREHAGWDAWQRRRERALDKSPSGQRPAALPLPRTYVQSGIIVIEDNGTVLGYDNLFDLVGRTFHYIPSASGFDAVEEPLLYDPDIGPVVIDNQQAFASYQQSLSFTFPFGSGLFSDLWVTTNLGIYFSPPAPPGPSQLHEADVLFDRTPRIGPAIMGTSLAGYTVHLREAADRVIVTWLTSALDVQATLFPSGEIRMSYAQFDYAYAAPTVVSGNESFWAGEARVGSAVDPADVTLGTPEDAAVDVVGLDLVQVGGSDLFYYDLTLLGPIPTSPALLYWDVALLRTPNDPSPAVYSVWYQNGAITYTNAPRVELNGSTIRLGLQLDPASPPVRLVTQTWHWNGLWQFADGAEVSTVLIPGIRPVMLDLSRDLPRSTDAPLFEAFTLPELRPYEVERVVKAEFGDLQPHGLAIYQNLYTDIIFYAGGYSTVGNSGADGIGVGNSTDPKAPALLHMNTLAYGWNADRGGRTLLLNQEFGHHWLYFARIDDRGSPSDILNPDGAHYAGWVHTLAAQPVFNPDDSSSLGGSTWTERGGGRFTSSPGFGNYGFNWVDLYLMGFADAAEVDTNGDWWYIKDPVPAPPRAYWPSPGSVVDSGVKVDVSIQQIILNHGPRFPAYPATERAMRVPFVLVTRAPPPAADVDTLRGYCDDWVVDWATSTLGRSSVTCADRYNQAPDGIIRRPSGAVTIDAGEALAFAGDWTDPDGDPVTWLWTFAGAAPDSTLQDPGAIGFPTPGSYDVCLTVTDVPGNLPDPEVPCVRLTVCEPPASLGNTLLLVKQDPATIRAHWTNRPGTDDYPLFASPIAAGPFASEVAAGIDGMVGEPFPMPAARVVFYRLAARTGACTGTVD